MSLKCQQLVNADLNRNVFRCIVWCSKYSRSRCLDNSADVEHRQKTLVRPAAALFEDKRVSSVCRL